MQNHKAGPVYETPQNPMCLPPTDAQAQETKVLHGGACPYSKGCPLESRVVGVQTKKG